MSNEAYTEPYDYVGADAQDMARALKSLREELEATDYYHQRAQTVKNPELKKILEHNRDEEKEHAIMLLEWLRRHMDGWDKELRDYIFTSAPITEIEDTLENGKGGENNDTPGKEGLGIGKPL